MKTRMVEQLDESEILMPSCAKANDRTGRGFARPASGVSERPEAELAQLAAWRADAPLRQSA
jgi:hypothetical protein